MYDSTAECEYEEGGDDARGPLVHDRRHEPRVAARRLGIRAGRRSRGSRIPRGDPVRKRDRRPGNDARRHLRVQRASASQRLQRRKRPLQLRRVHEAADCSGRPSACARHGYDGPTGVGTPDGIAAFEPTDEEVKRESEKRREETLSARAKLREEKKEEEAKNASGGSGGGGSTPGDSTTGVSNASSSSGTSGNPSSTTTSSTSGRPTTIKLTAFALTPTALLALNRVRPKVSSVRFAFTLSAAARVRATLAKLVRVRGHDRWELVVRTPSRSPRSKAATAASHQPRRAHPRPLPSDAHTPARQRTVDHLPGRTSDPADGIALQARLQVRRLLVLGLSPG